MLYILVVFYDMYCEMRELWFSQSHYCILNIDIRGITMLDKHRSHILADHFSPPVFEQVAFLNIMFHALKGRFLLVLFIFIFAPSSHSQFVFSFLKAFHR
jgi:hypothetical protein